LAYPVKTRRLRRGQRHNSLLLIWRGDGAVWLVQRPPRGVWAGLWSLPEAEDLTAWRSRAAQATWPGEGEALPPFTHVLTHLDWTLEPLRWQLPARLSAARLIAVEAALPAGRWFARTEALQAGLPAPVRRLLTL